MYLIALIFSVETYYNKRLLNFIQLFVFKFFLKMDDWDLVRNVIFVSLLQITVVRIKKTENAVMFDIYRPYSTNSLSAQNSFWNRSANCGACSKCEITGDSWRACTRCNAKNYPNPFSGVTKIVFMLPEDSRVKLNVFDHSCKMVKTLFDGEAYHGQQYNVDFEAGQLPSGVYFYTMITKNRVYTGKMILEK